MPLENNRILSLSKNKEPTTLNASTQYVLSIMLDPKIIATARLYLPNKAFLKTKKVTGPVATMVAKKPVKKAERMILKNIFLPPYIQPGGVFKCC